MYLRRDYLSSRIVNRITFRFHRQRGGSGSLVSRLAEVFKRSYVTLLNDLGKVATTLILVSPPLLEDVGRPFPDPGENNKRLQRTATFIKELAKKRELRLINLTDNLIPAGAKKKLTFNGQQFTQQAHERLSQVMLKEMGLAANRTPERGMKVGRMRSTMYRSHMNANTNANVFLCQWRSIWSYYRDITKFY